MWEPVKNDHKLGPDGTLFLGLAASVWIDEAEKKVKKSFAPGLTVAGEPKFDRNNSLEFFFKNELKYVKKITDMQSPRVSKILDIDVEKKEILYEYIGPDLLSQLPNLSLSDREVIDEELYIMFSEYTEAGFFKFNGGSHNMSWDGKRLLAFDFKWCEDQQAYTLYDEVYALLIWLGRFFPECAGKIVSEILVKKYTNADELIRLYYYLGWQEGFESPYCEALRPKSTLGVSDSIAFLRFLLQDEYDLFGVAATRLDCERSNERETFLVQHGIAHMIYVTDLELDESGRQSKMLELEKEFENYDIFPVQILSHQKCCRDNNWSLRNKAMVEDYISNKL